MDGWISKFPSKEQINEAIISMKDNFMEIANRAIHSTTEFFSDFLSEGKSVQSANISRAKDIQKLAEMNQKEEEQKQDDAQNALEANLENLHEKRMEELRKWGDLQYTDEDLDTALKNILNDREGVQARNGLTDEETDNVMSQVAYLLTLPKEERNHHLDNLDDKTKTAVRKELELVTTEKENRVEIETTIEQEQDHNDFLDLPEDDLALSNSVHENIEAMASLSPEEREHHLDNLGGFSPETVNLINNEDQNISHRGQASFATEITNDTAQTDLSITFSGAANDDQLLAGKGTSITTELDNSVVQQVPADGIRPLEIS